MALTVIPGLDQQIDNKGAAAISEILCAEDEEVKKGALHKVRFGKETYSITPGRNQRILMSLLLSKHDFTLEEADLVNGLAEELIHHSAKGNFLGDKEKDNLLEILLTKLPMFEVYKDKSDIDGKPVSSTSYTDIRDFLIECFKSSNNDSTLWNWVDLKAMNPEVIVPAIAKLAEGASTQALKKILPEIIKWKQNWLLKILLDDLNVDPHFIIENKGKQQSREQRFNKDPMHNLQVLADMRTGFLHPHAEKILNEAPSTSMTTLLDVAQESDNKEAAAMLIAKGVHSIDNRLRVN